MKMIHRGEKGFTLIELLVVIAILGVIAAVVALSVAGFFGRGTLQAANTELHQAQTAIIAAMADAETNAVEAGGDAETADGGDTILWAGEPRAVMIRATDDTLVDAADYVYGAFRAVYSVNIDDGDDAVYGIGQIWFGQCSGFDFAEEHPHAGINGWGPAIDWDPLFMNWKDA